MILLCDERRLNLFRYVNFVLIGNLIFFQGQTLRHRLVDAKLRKYLAILNVEVLQIMTKTSQEGTSKAPGHVRPIRGKPKSGRIWKSEHKRKSDIIQVKSAHVPWERRQKKRAEEKALKEYERELRESSKREKEEKRLKREEREKQREENRKKAEIVQRITNTAKIKRMKKKQLKSIEKR